MKKLLDHRFGLLVLLTIILASVSLLTRLALMIRSAAELDGYVLVVPLIFILGTFYDIVNAGYFIIPLVLYVWFVPDKLFTAAWHRFVLYGLFFLTVYGLVFNAVSEWLFWDEFNSRYNFIAVDYLIYTTEVLGNIQQSYPVELIIISVGVVAAAIVWFLRNAIRRAAASSIRFRQRSKFALLALLVPVLFFFAVSNTYHSFSDNPYVNELSGNGLYELFAAYRNNELDFDRFYNRIDDKAAFQLLREKLKTPDAEFVSDDPFNIERKITNNGPEKRLNVVLVSVESLSAD